MTNEQIKDLALQLLHADSEDEIINILEKFGYWSNLDVWRLYGDKEGNFAQVGSQQSSAEASLVEKIINSVDARLMSKCLTQGIDPISSEAPRNIRDAVAMFFENRRVEDDEAGTLSNWTSVKRKEESKEITIAATGSRPRQGQKTKKMCLTIVDQGEGQSPQRLPNTILSLNAKNKQRIRFVQGKFNMGGSGALRFCGRRGIQLVISRRHPDVAHINSVDDPTIDNWGLTIVRREEPGSEVGQPIHSEFTYLAPVGADQTPRNGEILSFDAEKLPIMPIHDEPYSRSVNFGTAIKLYEYDTKVGQSNVLLSDGLLYALERLLPEVALPVRVHECRGYRGSKERSFETTIAGLVVRLEEGRGENLELGFPQSAEICAKEAQMTARIYAFKEKKAKTYLKNEGVIFQINGQAHGSLLNTIFTKKKVGLPRLKDSLLVLVDCSSLKITDREDLFMTSRDRLSEKDIRFEIEEEIIEMLKHNDALRKLQNERRNQDLEEKLSEEKPLEEVLGKVLKASPALETLFLKGQRLTKPFASPEVGGSGGKEGEGGGSASASQNLHPFQGQKYPTFFNIKTVQYGEIYERNCEIGRRCRITFETDAENDYFDRATDKGSFKIEILDDGRLIPSANFSLHDGNANLNFSLPQNVQVGEKLKLQVEVGDRTQIEFFINIILLTVIKYQQHPGGSGNRKKKQGKGAGDKGTGIGISLPRVVPVKINDQNWKRYGFGLNTACHVETDPVPGEKGNEHTFYINVDNNSLKTEMKGSKQNASVLEAKFKYANVLLGLALLHDDESNHSKIENEENREPIQEQIKRISQAAAPVLLPMIDQLSGLDESELESMEVVDE